jgi:glutathione S-transferase
VSGTPSADMLKLYTINVSHFSEKARWALDYEGIAYREKVLLPGPHQLVTRRIARRTHVPVLEHDGQCVQGSSAIIDYIAASLGGTKLTANDPTERAKAFELEKELDQALGRGVQQVLYSAVLKDRRTVIDLWSSHAGCAAGAGLSRAGTSNTVAGNAGGACGSRSGPQRSTNLQSCVANVS